MEYDDETPVNALGMTRRWIRDHEHNPVTFRVALDRLVEDRLGGWTLETSAVVCGLLCAYKGLYTERGRLEGLHDAMAAELAVAQRAREAAADDLEWANAAVTIRSREAQWAHDGLTRADAERNALCMALLTERNAGVALTHEDYVRLARDGAAALDRLGNEEGD